MITIKQYLLYIIYIIYLYVLFSISGCADNTDIILSEDRSYVIQNIDIPDTIRSEIGGIDFFQDGRAAIAFLRGEIYIFNPENNDWTLFANGLHEPLGLKIVDDYSILVMQKPELSLLIDTDKDGKANIYKCLTDEFGLTGNYHEFAYGPAIDKAGNIYFSLNSSITTASSKDNKFRGDVDSTGFTSKGMYSIVPYRGWVMKFNSDKILQPFASGFRSPNGLCFDSNNNLLVTENQGDWVGTSKLYQVQEGNFYGHPASLIWRDDWLLGSPFALSEDYLDTIRTEASVLFPHDLIANSPTQPICDMTNGAFGPYGGQIFVGEMSLSSSKIVRVMLEEINGVLQGACTPFIDDEFDLRIGNNRLAYSPSGDLWVGQAAYGWVGSNGLQRIIYTGKIPFDILSMKLSETGFRLDFTLPLEEFDQSLFDEYFTIKKYKYLYHSKYGSPKITDKNIEIKKIELSLDYKSINIFIDNLEPGYIYELNINNIASNSYVLENKIICYTLNSLL